MTTAIKQKVIVGEGGRIEFRSDELVAGSEAEVIVLVETNDDDGEMPALVRMYDESKAEWEATGRETISLEQVRAELDEDDKAAA